MAVCLGNNNRVKLEVLMALITKITVLWDVTSFFWLVGVSILEDSYPEEGGSRFLQNFNTCLPKHMTSHATKP
jgi:hypothetical protein